MDQTVSTEKEYSVKLTEKELYFIQNALTGIDEFLHYLHFDLGPCRSAAYILAQGDNESEIDPVVLADKIFKQYHNEEGGLIQK